MWQNEVGGQLSYGQYKKETVDYLKRKFPNGGTVLDIGAGDGVWATLLKDHFVVDGVEIFEPWVEKYNLKEKYNKLIIDNALNVEFYHYDIVIMGDVLEHFTAEEGLKLFNYIYPRCDELVIAVPYQYPQEEDQGNPWQNHHQEDLTRQIFLQRYPGMSLLYELGNQDKGYGYFVKQSDYYKITVYAMCKNEAQFVDKWMDSMSEADVVVVLDTGSEDDTVEKLRSRGAIVKVQPISPWRFDVARNESMKLIPDDTDICVCTDLDEILEPGWAEALRRSWNPEATRRFYRYAWSHNPDGSPDRVFWYDKIHSHNEWYWEYPVHERLVYKGSRPLQNQRIEEGVVLHHYPDLSKSRKSYLPLLIQRAEETEWKDYNGLVFLANEYIYQGRQYQESLDVYLKILEIPEVYQDRQLTTYIYGAICERYHQLGKVEDAKTFGKMAINNDPTMRDPYMNLSSVYLTNKEYDKAIEVLEAALEKTYRHYIWTELGIYWSHEIYDRLGIAYYYKGDYYKSYVYFDLAILESPYIDRLKKNKNYAYSKITGKNL